jgi:DnaK suppressor protein
MVCRIRSSSDEKGKIGSIWIPYQVGWRIKQTMDKRRTKVFRDKLLGRREGLVGQVQAAELYSRERDAEATQDPADMAANAYTKELMVSMSDNDRQLLNLIDEALERIEAGGYAKCVHCGELLPDKRLDAVPWARHCVHCQDLHERGLLNVDED